MVLMAGCGTFKGPTPQVWPASPMVNLTDKTPRFEDTLVYDADSVTVGLFAAANETVSFQLVVDAGELPIGHLRLVATELAAEGRRKIPSTAVRAFRCLPVRVSNYPAWYLRLVDRVPRAADYYDALAPMDDAAGKGRLRVAPGQRVVLWIDVRVPRDADKGEYSGRLRLVSDTHADWTAKLVVKVYDFVLPDARALSAVGGFDHHAIYRAFVRRDGKAFIPGTMDRKNPLVREGLVLMRRLMQLAHEHRLDLFDKSLAPVLKRDSSGKVRLNWDDYDAIASPYLDGSAFSDRLGCAAWPAPLREGWPDPENYGGVDAEAYKETVAGILADCREHFDKGLKSPRQMFLWPYRGRVDAGAYERHCRLARLIRKTDKDSPILAELPGSPPKLTGWAAPKDFAALADMSAPPGEYFQPAQSSPAPGAGDGGRHPLAGQWLAPGMPPYVPGMGVIATPADVRALPWFAMKYGCRGLFLPEVLHWEGDALAPSAQTRLFYPGGAVGGEGIMPSVRLKRLRRGLQDVAYLHLLVRRRREGVARAILNAMTRYAGRQAAGDNYLDPRLGGWVQDPRAWQMARRLLAEEVQAAIHPKTLTPRLLSAQRVAWRMLDDETRDVVVEQIRARMLPTNTPGKLRLTVLVDLYNQYSRKVDVEVKLGKLPAKWAATIGRVRIGEFPATTRRVVELTARIENFPVTTSGKTTVPVILTTNLRPARTIPATVPYLLAAYVRKPPQIDGRLDDWTPRPGNTAGEFALIGRRGRQGSGLADRQTAVFVVCDEKNLYFALRCSEPNMSSVVARPNNIIQYQQLMACGEDLIEIILDPGAKGSGPEDLYHVAVKANGVLVTERGVRTSPPLGGAGPWPVGAVVAIGRAEGVWIVEMSIPFSSFAGGLKQRLWGVNFARFAVQGAEASSWSRAPRYFYDPRNLGTMLIPVAKEP